jgi:hypothetical protein
MPLPGGGREKTFSRVKRGRGFLMLGDGVLVKRATCCLSFHEVVALGLHGGPDLL